MSLVEDAVIAMAAADRPGPMVSRIHRLLHGSVGPAGVLGDEQVRVSGVRDC
jgi:hypothetical protein